MTKLAKIAARFRSEDDGAAMVEYSVLVGIITAATIALIVLVGGWVTGAWTDLCAATAGSVAAGGAAGAC